MTKPNWTTTQIGDIAVAPVLRFHVVAAGEIAVLARIEFAATPKNLDLNKLEAIQLAFAPAQALDLAKDLREAADHILSLPSPDRMN